MTSPISELIKGRRTIHQFKPQPVPEHELIIEAIEHAIWAPNHKLTEPWRFHLIGRETSDKICQLNARLVEEQRGTKAAEVKLKRWQEIPGWLLLTCLRSEDEIQAREDFAACCCVAQNLMLYLWQAGVGVKWTTGEVTRDEKFFEIVNIDAATQSVIGLFWYGYAADIPQTTRKPLTDILFELP